MTRLRGNFVWEVFLHSLSLRLDPFSPDRDSGYRSAPKPGKEKQKSDDYRSAILIIHRFESFLSVFTPVMRNIWREVTRKMAKTFEITRMLRIGIMEKRGSRHDSLDLADGGSRRGRPTIERSFQRSVRRHHRTVIARYRTSQMHRC